MMFKRLFSFWCGFALVFLFSIAPAHAGLVLTQGEAVADCQAEVQQWLQVDPTDTGWVCVLKGDGTPAGYGGDSSGLCASGIFSGAYYTADKDGYDAGDNFTWCIDVSGCHYGRTENVANRWADGTECDDQGCMLSLILGGLMNGDRFETGAACPYDPDTKPPKDAPPQPPSPPECNADGSCQQCAGDKCGSSGGDNNPAPPAPSGSTGDSHSTQSHSDGGSGPAGGGGSPGGGGDPSGGGSTGGTGGTGGDTGSGTGSAPATASSANTKCTTGVCDVGDADGQMGGLYQGSSQTPSQVFGSYMSQIESTPLVSAVGGFFQVSAGGSCPSWHIPGNQYWGQAGFDFTFFCQSAMLAIFQLAGYLVLAAGAFCAFRIAIY